MSDAVYEQHLWARWRSLPRLLRLLWQLAPGDLLWMTGISFIGGLIPLASLILLQRLVDGVYELVAGRASLSSVILILAALIVSNLLGSLFGFSITLMEDVQERVKARAQEQLLRKASHLPLAAFEQSTTYDQLLRAQEGLDTRLWRVLYNLLPLIPSLVSAISLLIFAGTAHWLFPLVLLAGLVPTTIVEGRLFKRAYFIDRSQTPLRRRQSYLSDLMVMRGPAAEIRLFGLQSHIFQRYYDVFLQLRAERLRRARDRQNALIIPGMLQALTTALVLAASVILVVRRRLSLGSLAALFGTVDRLYEALNAISFCLLGIDGQLRYLQDLFDYLDLPEEASDGSSQDAGTLQPASALDLPTVRFEGVSFSYPGSSRPVLHGLDLTLRPGERIALVGENGAGKSTLARLLLGLYRPTEGRITVDGVPLEKLAGQTWKKRVAVVFQDYVRYELTALDNIGFGDVRRSADREAVALAAQRSGATAVIEALPDRYETMLGRTYDERGQDLSTGQWQKLAIARAYLRDAMILVLDEPTAALDAQAEVEVYRHFRDMAQGKSVLLISHRLGSARLADRIVVLEGGKIVEQGTHAELTERGGRYATMFATQAQWYR